RPAGVAIELAGQGVACAGRLGHLHGGRRPAQAGGDTTPNREPRPAGDAGAGGDRLYAAARAAATLRAVAPDIDVADVAGVATRAVDQPALDHDPTAHARGGHHPQEAARSLARALPVL